jgi:hypothetical protein
MTNKKLAISKKNGTYYFTNGYLMKRESESKTPNGCRMAGRWVLRNGCGKLIDFDLYINDIAERQNLELYNPPQKQVNE